MYAGDIPSQLIGKRALKGILVGTVGPRRRFSSLAFHGATNSRQTRRRLRGLRAPCRSGGKVKGQRFTRGGGFPFYPPGAGARVQGLLGLSASVCETVLCGTSACETFLCRTSACETGVCGTSACETDSLVWVVASHSFQCREACLTGVFEVERGLGKKYVCV